MLYYFIIIKSWSRSIFILNLIYFLAGKKCMAISAITTFFNTVSNQFQLVGTISLLSQSMITTSLPLSIPSFPTNSLLYSHQVFHKCSNNLMHKFLQNVRDILQKLCFEKPIPYWYKVNNSLKKKYICGPFYLKILLDSLPHLQ